MTHQTYIRYYRLYSMIDNVDYGDAGHHGEFLRIDWMLNDWVRWGWNAPGAYYTAEEYKFSADWIRVNLYKSDLPRLYNCSSRAEFTRWRSKLIMDAL